MRYRALDANGDMTFGHSKADFLVDSPEAVAQVLKTRFGLATGEWFLDVTEGTPYGADILGKSNRATYDQAIRGRILDTPGVSAINTYSSSLVDRRLTVVAEIETIYGPVIATFKGIAPGGTPTPAPSTALDFFFPDNSGLLPAI
jgi:hypothetical protein